MTNIKNDWRDEFDKFGEIYSLPHGKYTSVKGDKGEITPYIWEGRWATRSLESFIAQTRKDAVEEVINLIEKEGIPMYQGTETHTFGSDIVNLIRQYKDSL